MFLIILNYLLVYQYFKKSFLFLCLVIMGLLIVVHFLV